MTSPTHPSARQAWERAFWYVAGFQDANQVHDSAEAIRFADHYGAMADDYYSERTYMLPNMPKTYRQWRAMQPLPV